MTRVFEPHIGPRLTAIDGFINTITRRDTALRIVLTGSNPQRVTVIRIDFHNADGV